MRKTQDAFDRQYVGTTTYAAEAPAIRLDDETEQYRVLSHKRADLWEETAFALVAESGDHDVLLWTAGYIIKGQGRRVWIDEDAVEHDIMLIAVPKANRGKMTDNNFVRAGWHPTERLQPRKLRIERTHDRVVWHFEDHRFVARPPVWEAQGLFAGVDLDLRFSQVGQPIWHWGHFADAETSDRAGYDVFADVDGTLATAGRTFEIRNGHGVREHILVGQSADPIRNLPAPRVMYWLYLTKDDVGINFFRPGIVDIGAVYVGERAIKYNPAANQGAISFETTEHWHDPRSATCLPIRWHLTMTSTECVVDLDMSCHGRAYSFWHGDAGTRMYCYLLCTANGALSLPDGRTVAFEDHVMLNSFNRTILVKSETLDGPVY